ncbi:unnamed protein product, partial [Mesorhabditis belari]|uniref:Uncharacterized protein n=1 Tax=Mesorhabditis belari TaxID=2138241 RepID=A0AAF3EXB3_9BILA
MNTLHSGINFLLLLHTAFGHSNQQQSQEEPLSEISWSELHSTLVTQQHQAQQFAQSTALFKELASVLDKMLKSDDFEARVLIEIRKLISRLGSEKNETEQFLKRMEKQRLAISNKKDEQLREKKRLEDEDEEASSEEENEGNQHERGSRVIRGWSFLHRAANDQMNSAENLKTTGEKLEREDPEDLQDSDEKDDETRVAIEELDDRVKNLVSMLEEISTIYDETNDLDKQLNEWLLFLNKILPHGMEIGKDLDLDNEKLIEKSLKELKHKLNKMTKKKHETKA